jgi:pimeloyl-ACP methyl ester carboxylesterase
MLHHSIYKAKKENAGWITFIHGAGGSSAIWFKQIRFFSKNFNLLLIDLRGHGASKDLIQNPFKTKYSFESIAEDIIEVMDHVKIEKSHFVGISLGTILIRQLAEMQPKRVYKMVMGGAILELNLRSRILMYFGNATKSVLPYMWLYRFFAFIIMPNRNHKESRILFIREAKKLYQKEFIRWFKLTSEIIPKLRIFRKVTVDIPTLYIMGDQDYMFLPSVQKVTESHSLSQLLVLEECGHVVNVEKPGKFNDGMLSFLEDKV